MNMRFWVAALAEPNRMAAHVLTTSPMNVRTLGLMRESASQRTMVSSRTPQARPKAEVQERLIGVNPGLRARARMGSVSFHTGDAWSGRGFFRPPGLVGSVFTFTHDLRCGLHSYGAPRQRSKIFLAL